MKTFIKIAVIAVLVLVAVGIWQNRVNSLSYQLRNCTETSDNSGYIGFRCPSKNPAYPPTMHYIPDSERDQVTNLLSPVDSGSGSL